MEDVAALKAVARAKDSGERRLQERRRNVLVLILRYLCDYGYTDAYERLSTESGCSLQQYNAADNVELDMIIQEFEWSYEAKFGKKVKLVSKCAEEVSAGAGQQQRNAHSASSRTSNKPSSTLPNAPSNGRPEGLPRSGAALARDRREKAAAAEAEQRRQDSSNGRRLETSSRSAGGATDRSNSLAAEARNGLDLGIQGVQAGVAAGGESSSEEDPQEFYARRLLKPLPEWLSGELRELGAAIQRDILVDCPAVRWEDISGLHDAKRLLKEAVVMPLKYPQLFTGILTPWRGILLYGPPGTGKTLLAKAVATECRTTFFNISASSIISKWRGDSEKLVRVLFDLARYHAPSTIFLDEVDALMGARGGEGEHEASRRMKTELLVQLDGLAATSDADIFLLAASNLPWELDMAMLRRLEKRILVPLPDEVSRGDMFSSLLGGRTVPEVSFADMAARTAGFSGSDVKVAAKEAAMRPLRRLMQQLESGALGGSAKVEVGKVTEEDVHKALQVTKPTGQQHDAMYTAFSNQYGQVL